MGGPENPGLKDRQACRVDTCNVVDHTGHRAGRVGDRQQTQEVSWKRTNELPWEISRPTSP